MSNFISGTISAVNSSIKYDDYLYGIQVNGATKLRNAQTQGTTIISGSLATNIASSGGEMITLTSNQAQKGFLSGQAVGFVRAAINKCYQNADGKAVIVFNDNKISDFVCSETYSTVQAVLATSIFGSSGSGTFNTLSGDVVSQVTGGATTIQTAVVTNAKLATVPTATIKGKDTAGTGAPKDLTVAEVKAMLSINNVDNTTDANKPVSTAQATALGGKQATLVSGTNIKTVNGNSLLGSGDITISGGGGSSLTEYGVAVSGGSGGITARFYGTSLITVTRAAADTYQFNIPASGFLQSWELYLPIADNAVAGFTFKFVYASPTFNTNFQTMKPCVIQMMTDTGNTFVNRAAPAATDFADTRTIPTSGTLQQVVTVPSAIQGVVLKVIGKF